MLDHAQAHDRVRGLLSGAKALRLDLRVAADVAARVGPKQPEAVNARIATLLEMAEHALSMASYEVGMNIMRAEMACADLTADDLEQAQEASSRA